VTDTWTPSGSGLLCLLRQARWVQAPSQQQELLRLHRWLRSMVASSCSNSSSSSSHNLDLQKLALLFLLVATAMVAAGVHPTAVLLQVLPGLLPCLLYCHRLQYRCQAVQQPPPQD
jgi:hypothetical protein